MYRIELHKGNSIRKICALKSSSKVLLRYNTILSKNVLIEQKYFRKKNNLIPISCWLVLKDNDEIMFKTPYGIEEKFKVGSKRLCVTDIIKQIFHPIRGYHCAVSYYGCNVIVNNFRKIIPIGCKCQSDAIRLYRWLLGELHGEFMFMGELKNPDLLLELKKLVGTPSRKKSRSLIDAYLE